MDFKRGKKNVQSAWGIAESNMEPLSGGFTIHLLNV